MVSYFTKKIYTHAYSSEYAHIYIHTCLQELIKVINIPGQSWNPNFKRSGVPLSRSTYLWVGWRRRRLLYRERIAKFPGNCYDVTAGPPWQGKPLETWRDRGGRRCYTATAPLHYPPLLSMAITKIWRKIGGVSVVTYPKWFTYSPFSW